MKRREFLIAASSLATFVPVAWALSSCGSPPAPDAAQIQRQLRQKALTLIEGKLKMQFREKYALPSGFNAAVYSSSAKLGIDPTELNRAFMMPSTVLAIQPESSLKARMQQSYEKAGASQYSDRELFMVVSDDPASCIGSDTIIEHFSNGAERSTCATMATTISIAQTDITRLANTGMIDPVKLGIMILTPAASDGIAELKPRERIFRLTPEQALISALGHETVHWLLRMLGGLRNDTNEEAFASQIENDLLVKYEANPALRPRPFRWG